VHVAASTGGGVSIPVSARVDQVHVHRGRRLVLPVSTPGSSAQTSCRIRPPAPSPIGAAAIAVRAVVPPRLRLRVGEAARAPVLSQGKLA